jgi:transcriptional regulator with XRE-family HTH domain
MVKKLPARKKPYQKNPRFLTELRLARLRTGLQQREVAQLLGIYIPDLCELECGLRNPTPAQRSSLSAFFGILPETLFPPTEKS